MTSYKSTPERIRTSNRLIRSQVLYPIELRVQKFSGNSKNRNFFTASQSVFNKKSLLKYTRRLYILSEYQINTDTHPTYKTR